MAVGQGIYPVYLLSGNRSMILNSRLHTRFLIFFFIVWNFVYSQNCKCEGAEGVLKTIERLLKKGDMDSAKLVQLGFSSNAKGCEQTRMKVSGKINYRLKNIDLAKSDFNHERDFLVKNACSAEDIMDNCLSLGLVYLFSDQLDSAAFWFHETLKLGEGSKNEKFITEAYSNLGRTFGKERQFEKAAYYIKKAIRLNEKNKNEFSLAKNYSVLGTAYTSLFNKTQTETAYLDSIDGALNKGIYYSKKSGNKDALYSCYGNKASLADHYKRYDVSIKYLDSIIALADHSLDIAPLNIAYFKKAYVLLHQGKTKESLIFADSALKYGIRGNTLSSVADVYGLIYEANMKAGDYRLAVAAHERMFKLKDSLHSVEKNERINDLEQKYNKFQNEKTIKELGQEKEILSQREQISKLKINALIIGVLLLVLIFVAIVFFYRQKALKSKYAVLEAEQRLNRARINPHFFFNALASLQALANEGKQGVELSDYIYKFSKIMRESLESTFSELTTIENEIEFLTHYLELQKLRSDHKFTYEFITDEAIEISELMLPGMILQPFVENSIEHGFSTMNTGGLIKIEFLMSKSELKIHIEDNGSGVSGNETHKNYPSRATQIIRDRLFLLNKQMGSSASFEVLHLTENKGTLVVITLPIIPKK